MARAKILHAGANDLDTGHAGHGRPGHGSPDRTASEAASILELEGKETTTINEIITGTRLALLDCKDRENKCHPLLDLNLVR